MDAFAPRVKSLVLVDDDPHLLNALRFAFETDGYQVTALKTGEALLESPPTGAQTCIVIDERLPGLTGLETLARLRRLGVTAPAILVTSHPSPYLQSRAAAAKVEIVEKPLLGDLLASRVREALR
jgi:two-component system, LuxR family, response regulator FixJ